MDENNVNSKPLDSVDGDVENIETEANEAEVVETAETEEAEVVEAVDAESEAEAIEAVDAEVEAEIEETADAEVEADVEESVDAEETDNVEGVSEVVETAEPAKKKKKGKGAIITIAALGFIIIAAIVGMVAVVMNSVNAKIDLEQTVLTVDDVESSAAEFYQAYMYYYGYNSYYQYSDEELKDLAIDQLVLTDTLYAEALAKGYTVTDEIQAQIDEQLGSITETAEASSMTADEYLDKSFCKGFTLDMFKVIVEKSLIAQAYYEDKMAEIQDQYKGDKGTAKIEAEYTENKFDYDQTDVSYWYFDASEENAQADADAIVAQVNDGKTFEEAIKSVTGDSEAIPNNLKGHSKSALESGKFVTDAIEWIFAENEDGTYKNGKGSVTTVADDSKVYVFYVNNAPHRDETHPVDVLYIQVDVSTDSSIKTEKELKIEAKAAAEAILKEFEGTDKSLKSFTDLVIKHNNGDNDLVSGDMFEALKNDGSEDAAVEEWAFDESRKAGDYALVEADGCYYVLFFDKKAENAVWYDTILNSLITNEARGFEENAIAQGTEKAVINDEAVNEVINYVVNVVAAQYGY